MNILSDHKIITNGLLQQYVTVGQGPVVLCPHGWPQNHREFRSGVESFNVSLGAGYGVKIFGGRESHDLALISFYCGWMVGPIEGEGHWYHGNWEVRDEMFAGSQGGTSA